MCKERAFGTLKIQHKRGKKKRPIPHFKNSPNFINQKKKRRAPLRHASNESVGETPRDDDDDDDDGGKRL